MSSRRPLPIVEAINDVNNNNNHRINPGQQCPICLDDILGLSYVLECMHSFCGECIGEWVAEHNKCPMCRQTIDYVCTNIRSDKDYDMVEVLPPVSYREYVIQLSPDMSLVMSPSETGIFMIVPHWTRRRLNYTLQYLHQSEGYIVRSVAGTLYVLPDDLTRVLRRLEDAGIHQHIPHLDSHPKYMKNHHHHQTT